MYPDGRRLSGYIRFDELCFEVGPVVEGIIGAFKCYVRGCVAYVVYCCKHFQERRKLTYDAGCLLLNITDKWKLCQTNCSEILRDIFIEYFAKCILICTFA